MSQGLYAASSAIRTHQLRMDVISNNVANINTIGFKGSSANFQTVFARTMFGGSPPTRSIGGANPRQVGAGVVMADITQNFSQGSSQLTGRSSDVMVNGKGFFVIEPRGVTDINAAAEQYFTRAGNFFLDGDGNLVTANGFRIQGTSQEVGSSPQTTGRIYIPQRMVIYKQFNATNQVIASFIASSIPAAAPALVAGATSQPAPATVTLKSFSIGNQGNIVAEYSNGDRFTVRTDDSTVDPLDPSATRREIVHLSNEGRTLASFNVTVDDDGPLAQVAGFEVFNGPAVAGGEPGLRGMQLQMKLASVSNQEGLLGQTSTYFATSSNVGETRYGIAGTEDRDVIQSGQLESSNVDLSTEFTNLILTQRGLEANSRIVSAYSSVLETIVNMDR